VFETVGLEVYRYRESRAEEQYPYLGTSLQERKQEKTI
jgi:hypothetical protein